jgi:hypothetical protein
MGSLVGVWELNYPSDPVRINSMVSPGTNNFQNVIVETTEKSR